MSRVVFENENKSAWIPGQGSTLHITVLVVFPVQFCPPYLVGGFVQDLVCVRNPPPHVLLQFPESVHPVKLPSTNTTRNNILIIVNTFTENLECSLLSLRCNDLR